LTSPRLEPPAGYSGVLAAIIVVIVTASLYFGREIFVPLALAILLSFALAPLVRFLHRRGLPRLPSVLVAVTLGFSFILAFSTVVAFQVADLAAQLPLYERNIEAKIDAVRESPPGGRLFERASEMMRDIGRKIEEGEKEAATSAADQEAAEEQPEPQPIPVVVERPDPTPMQLLQTIVGPLIDPLATAGIVIVLVIFMLLKREDLRDRLIRLAGTRDLPSATGALNDAAQRVGHYLLMTLVVNTTYGLPVGIGLWLIGVPNPILWGMLATVLRFVPYIGPIIAASFPLALAVAVDPGWETLLWTAALLIVIELISNNIVEPWLYGSSTGLSPIAIIAAAIFWTWLWGPVGLLLSTPLTVCLVVLGQHIPQLAFLDVLFGSDPVLTPAEGLYQRLLADDPHEATEQAEECLREMPLEAYYDTVALPALELAERDRGRGMLDDERLARVVEGAMLLIDNLEEFEEPAPTTKGAERPEEESEPDEQPESAPDDRVVLCAAARGSLDQVPAAMLMQLFGRRGVSARELASDALQSAKLRELNVGDVAGVVLSYTNADSMAHARFLVRRLRRRFPEARIVVGFWTLTPEDRARRDPTEATGADRVVTTLTEGLTDMLAELGYPTEEKEEPTAEIEAAGREEAPVSAVGSAQRVAG
jgi:predicted PurR-regulated permease PerM